MLTAKYTNRFKKNFELMKKRNKDMEKIALVMRFIINETPLPPIYREHPLQGTYKDTLECHIEPDWFLVYKVEPTLKRVTFYRTGAHSDLF
ncbi:MAG: type II toxin-antitoxin system YafQ family toxin [Spirochaetaceae bacterium]|jgi:mRNA interferase YafQ|nr:type II toxin-antitoxin system YafQ family toxin [Spirochaetaceae bacterium]